MFMKHCHPSRKAEALPSTVIHFGARPLDTARNGMQKYDDSGERSRYRLVWLAVAL